MDFKICKNCWWWNALASRRDIDPSAFCKVKDDRTKPHETCSEFTVEEPDVKTQLKSLNLNKVSKPRSTAAVELPKEETVETDRLYAHQREAVERYKNSKEICLFWEMGVGKSNAALAIAAAKFDAGEIDALLIIAPNDVHTQWFKQQLPEWLSCRYEAQCFGGRGGLKQTYPFTEPGLHVLCVNIDTFSTPSKWKDIVEWANAKKTMIILDEATTIKNPSAKRTERLIYEFNNVVWNRKTVKSSVKREPGVRCVLTGTPVTNGPMDLWSMMEFIRPNFFGRNYYSFKNHYGMFTNIDVNGRAIAVPLTEEKWQAIKEIKEYGMANAVFGVSEDTFNYIHSQDRYVGPYKHAEELKEMLEPVSSFKLLTDCVDMPEQSYVTHRLQMSPEIREAYDSMVEEYIAEYDGHTVTALNKITVIIRLQQISSGFIFDKDKLLPEKASKTCGTCANLEGSLCKIMKVEKNFDDGASGCGLYKQTEAPVPEYDETFEDIDITPEDPVKWIGGSNPKLDALERDVAESAKPVIIITRFSAEAARIHAMLSSQYSCCLMTGWKRIGSIEEFQAGKYDVMVANSAVVARGFNLQNSHTMIFYSNTFSLEQRLQAEGRIFRLGQNNVCQYIDYVYDDTVDGKIVSVLKMKRNLLDYIRGVDITEVLK